MTGQLPALVVENQVPTLPLWALRFPRMITSQERRRALSDFPQFFTVQHPFAPTPAPSLSLYPPSLVSVGRVMILSFPLE